MLPWRRFRAHSPHEVAAIQQLLITSHLLQCHERFHARLELQLQLQVEHSFCCRKNIKLRYVHKSVPCLFSSVENNLQCHCSYLEIPILRIFDISYCGYSQHLHNINFQTIYFIPHGKSYKMFWFVQSRSETL